METPEPMERDVLTQDSGVMKLVKGTCFATFCFAFVYLIIMGVTEMTEHMSVEEPASGEQLATR